MASDCAPRTEPHARQVDWTPLSRGGTNLATRRLRRVEPNRFEFRSVAMRSTLRAILPLLLGATVLVVWARSRSPEQLGAAWQILALFLGAALLAGLLLGLDGGRPRFDFTNGTFRKVRLRSGGHRCENPIRLTEIRALQLLAHEHDQHISYELNLVLGDASRIPVVAHGGLKALREDATELGRLLGVPLWDGSERSGPPSSTSV